MALTYQIQGNLFDLGLEAIPGKMPQLFLVINAPSIFGFSSFIESDPKECTVFPDGGWVVDAADTDQMRNEYGDVYYTLRLVKADPDAYGDQEGFVTVDYPQWKIRTPGRGGYFGDLISLDTAIPNGSQIVWASEQPDPWPEGVIWLNSITGDVNRMGPNMVVEFLGNVTGPEGPEGDKGDKGDPGVNAVPAATAVATYAETDGNPVKIALDEAYVSRGKILCLGTSIAVGYGTTNFATKCYPTRLAVGLNSALSGVPITVINGGVSADSTSDMRARLADLLKEHHPEIVTIELSINDPALNKNVPAATTAENMAVMAFMCRAAGATPVFLTHQSLNAAQANAPLGVTDATNALATQNRLNLLTQAAALGVLVVDIFAVMQHKPNTLDDGIHPNDAGAQMWADAIAQVLLFHNYSATTAAQFTDTFDRTASALTPGPGWTAVSGSVFGTTGTRAYVVSGPAGAATSHTAVVEAASIEVEMFWPSGTPQGGLIVEYNPTDKTGYVCTYETAGGVTVAKVYVLLTGGAYQIAASAALTMTGTDKLEAVISPKGGFCDIVLWHNGAPVLSAHDNVYTGRTAVALYAGSNTAAQWDNLKVRS